MQNYRFENNFKLLKLYYYHSTVYDVAEGGVKINWTRTMLQNLKFNNKEGVLITIFLWFLTNFEL